LWYVVSKNSYKKQLVTVKRYGGMLLSRFEILAFNFLVVYLAIIQGSLAAGQWLSFGPSRLSSHHIYVSC